jgi:hypothetical protein
MASCLLNEAMLWNRDKAVTMAHGRTWAAASVGKRVARSTWSGGDAVLAARSALSTQARVQRAESHWPGGPSSRVVHTVPHGPAQIPDQTSFPFFSKQAEL